ncbi:hypothetical protein [Porphyrobacter sp. AAP82]|uniref:hypothetical protein n=1 Tax=Porphyrobacter sp. AAP82 TaxID=1248917 RepID=UPI0012DC8981|nr:hypothetical protein [Porphyrobacter sp. AAP82]
MAKLSIELDEHFKTDGFWVTEDFEDVFLKGEDAIKYLSDIDKGQMCLVIVTYKEDDPYDSVKFEFKQCDKKSKDNFYIDLIADGSGLSVSVQGSLSVKIRSGAEAYLNQKNKLKILGVEYLGGSYRGFSSYIQGYDKENPEHWRDIGLFKLS